VYVALPQGRNGVRVLFVRITATKINFSLQDEETIAWHIKMIKRIGLNFAKIDDVFAIDELLIEKMNDERKPGLPLTAGEG
jgi:hypothetical protein